MFLMLDDESDGSSDSEDVPVIIIYTLLATKNVIHNMHQRSTILILKVLNSFINITQMYVYH